MYDIGEKEGANGANRFVSEKNIMPTMCPMTPQKRYRKGVKF